MAYFNIFTIEESVEEWSEVTENQKLNLNKLFDDFMGDTINKKYYLNIVENPEHILTELYKKNKNLNDLKRISNNLAEMLLRAEQIQDKNGKIRRNKTIKSGVLIFKATRDYLILMKLEIVDAIDLKDFSRTETFGGEKNYFKIAKMEFKEKSEGILDIDIYDTGAKVAKYWTEKLLSIVPKRDNELNTIDLIQHLKEKRLFKDHLDVTIDNLTDSVDGFLSNNIEFSFDDLTSYINADLKTDYNVNELFSDDILSIVDSDFKLDKITLGKYLRKKVYISEGIYLELDDYKAALGRGQIKLSLDNRYIQIRIDDSKLKEIKENLPRIKKGN